MDNRTELQSSGFGGPGLGIGGGIGGFGLVGLIGLLSGRGLGHDGGGDHCQRDLLLMNKLGDIQLDVATAASGLKDVTQNQTLFIQNTLAQLALGAQQGFASIKDSVQVGILNNNQNTQAILGAICGLASKIDQNTIIELQNELNEARSRGHVRDSEINISQNVNQAQAQAQQQQQAVFHEFSRRFDILSNQLNKTNNDVINFGTMAASGNQSTQATNIK